MSENVPGHSIKAAALYREPIDVRGISPVFTPVLGTGHLPRVRPIPSKSKANPLTPLLRGQLITENHHG